MREGFNRFAKKLALGAALATGAGATEGCDDKRPVEPQYTQDFFATAENEQEKNFRKEILDNDQIDIQSTLEKMGYSDRSARLNFLDQEYQKASDRLSDLRGIHGAIDAQTEKEIEQLETYLTKIGELKEAL